MKKTVLRTVSLLLALSLLSVLASCGKKRDPGRDTASGDTAVPAVTTGGTGTEKENGTVGGPEVRSETDTGRGTATDTDSGSGADGQTGGDVPTETADTDGTDASDTRPAFDGTDTADGTEKTIPSGSDTPETESAAGMTEPDHEGELILP